MRCRFPVFAPLVIAALALPARAGMAGFLLSFPGNPPATTEGSIDTTAGTISSGVAYDGTIDGSYDYHGVGTVVSQLSGDLENDPVCRKRSIITNDTLIPWTSYSLSIPNSEPYNTFVNPAATSAVDFNTLNTALSLVYFSDKLIIFGAPGVVNPGDDVLVTYFVNVNTTGIFTLTVSETPQTLPEPAALSLLACGAAALITRRVRSKGVLAKDGLAGRADVR